MVALESHMREFKLKWSRVLLVVLPSFRRNVRSATRGVHFAERLPFCEHHMHGMSSHQHHIQSVGDFAPQAYDGLDH